MSRAIVDGALALVAVLALGYWAFGPPGLLAGPASGGLLEPGDGVDDLGTAVAVIDPVAWARSCEESGLPDLPDLSGVDLVPVRRLIAESRHWAETREPDSLGRMGAILIVIDLPEAALDYLLAARELGGDRERWSYYLGVAAQDLGWGEVALDALQEVRSTNDGFGLTHARLGALYLENGDLDLADAAYRKSVELMPGPTRCLGWVGQARVSLERGDPQEALARADEAVAVSPFDFLSHRVRAKALAQLGRVDEARTASEHSQELPTYRGWVTFDPRLAEAHQLASTRLSLEGAMQAAISTGELGAACQAAELLVERSPRSADDVSRLASLLANAGEVERALELAQRARELDPGGLERLETLASIAVAADRPDLALECASEIELLSPLGPLAPQVRGRVEFRAGRIEPAIQHLREAVRRAPTDARGTYLLVDVLLRSGRKDEAVEALHALLALVPREARARELLESLSNS